MLLGYFSAGFSMDSRRLRSVCKRVGAAVLLGMVARAGYAQHFQNPYRVSTSATPSNIFVGDFNGDGKPDLGWVDSSTTPATLHILLQKNGSFVTGVSMQAPNATSHPPECVAADFNGDGRTDIACTNAYQFADGIDVYLGNGDGSFQPPIYTDVPMDNNGNTAFPLLNSPGDVNGDGLPDLILTQQKGAANQVLLSDGHGGFQLGAATPAGQNDAQVLLADINGDGVPDQLLANGPQVLLGTGRDQFGPLQDDSVSTYPGSGCVFHDMEANGHLDAVCVGTQMESDPNVQNQTFPSGPSALTVLHGNADGSFNTTPLVTQTYGTAAVSFSGEAALVAPIAVYDANGDGVPDVLAQSQADMAMLLGGTGLTFQTPRYYVIGTPPGSPAGSPQFVQLVADMNGDGLPDVISVGPLGIYISYGVADGTFATAQSYEVSPIVSTATVADFNGDGVPDIVASGDVPLHISFGVGDGSFAPPTNVTSGTDGLNFQDSLLIHGDFNGDGKKDVISVNHAVAATDPTLTPYIFFGRGDGTAAECQRGAVGCGRGADADDCDADGWCTGKLSAGRADVAADRREPCSGCSGRAWRSGECACAGGASDDVDEATARDADADAWSIAACDSAADTWRLHESVLHRQADCTGEL